MGSPGAEVVIGPARPEDEPALAALDRRTWSWQVAPVPLWPEGTPFFDDGTRPEEVLVARAGDALAGYLKLRSCRLPASAHVQEIHGMAVEPTIRRAGVGRRLLEAARAEALARGARRVVLQVLGTNAPALALYRAAGFVEEGRRRGQFILEGLPVDDVLMALHLR